LHVWDASDRLFVLQSRQNHSETKQAQNCQRSLLLLLLLLLLLPAGRYKDPQQHQQRLADMQSRCAALFNGTMTQHWSIVNHKSISCHLCSQNITPYAAYHPDCLRCDIISLMCCKLFALEDSKFLALSGVVRL
jgi:hypothetical protein